MEINQLATFRPGAAALMLLAALASCARPPSPPMLTLGGTHCDPAPVVEGAVPVPFDSRTGASATLGLSGRCLQPHQPGSYAATYAVFRLPDSAAPIDVAVFSQVVGSAIVSPRLMLLDDTGRLLRVVPPEAFRSSFAGLRTELRSEPSERILVVEADTARLGQGLPVGFGAKSDGRFQIAAHGGVIFIPIVVPGQPAHQTPPGPVMALNGVITVTALAVRTPR